MNKNRANVRNVSLKQNKPIKTPIKMFCSEFFFYILTLVKTTKKKSRDKLICHVVLKIGQSRPILHLYNKKNFIFNDDSMTLLYRTSFYYEKKNLSICFINRVCGQYKVTKACRQNNNLEV